MATQVIVLNGGSSSGKSSLARCLQEVLPDPWLTFGADTLVEALPASGGGIEFGPDGEVVVGPVFQALDVAWSAGVAAMARGGARVIIDEVFVGGSGSQERWRSALDGLDVLWVGVRCDGAVAAAREAARGDRIAGMAESQASAVHEGVTYDVEVDTTRTETIECARAIAAHIASGDAPAALNGTTSLPEFATHVTAMLREHFGVESERQRQVLNLAEEVGEFVGAYRRWAGLARRTGPWEDVTTELADVVITAYVTAEVLGIDLDAAWRDKAGVILSRGWRA